MDGCCLIIVLEQTEDRGLATDAHNNAMDVVTVVAHMMSVALPFRMFHPVALYIHTTCQCICVGNYKQWP